MYAMRFGQVVPAGVSLAQLRGLEGQRMKATYKILAAQHSVVVLMLLRLSVVSPQPPSALTRCASQSRPR